MRFVALIVTMFATQNAFAQDQTDPPPEPTAEPAADQTPSNQGAPPEPAVDPRVQQCLDSGGGDACCNGLTACRDAQAEVGQATRDLLDDYSNAYGETPEQSGRRMCGAAGGIWGDLWDGSNWWNNCQCKPHRDRDDEHRLCVPDNAEYLEQICTESGGRWTGGNCDCRGRQREGGRCTGQNRIEELMGQLATAQATADSLGEQLETANTDLATARANGASQTDQIAALERQRDALQAQLNQAMQDIAYLRGRLEAEDIEVPPEQIPSTVTPPGTAEPIPGAVAAAAEVAAESTEPPVGQVPTAEEEEEWPEWAKWLLGIGIAGAVTAGTLIPLCESGVICHTSLVQ